MEMRVDSTAHDGHRGNSRLFKRYVVSPGKEPEQVNLVDKPCFLSCRLEQQISLIPLPR